MILKLAALQSEADMPDGARVRVSIAKINNKDREGVSKAPRQQRQRQGSAVTEKSRQRLWNEKSGPGFKLLSGAN